MKKRFFAFLPLVALFAGGLFIFSCEKEEEENESSHNAGQNCMTCHKSGGSGDGVWTVAGTVYNADGAALSGATIKLFSDAVGTGTALATLTSDKSGNFHTSTAINFGTGLYAKVTSGTSTISMVTPLVTGACNSCHVEGNRIHF